MMLFSDTYKSNYFCVEEFVNSHEFFKLSPELSRRMRALSPYIAFRHFGMDKMGRNVLFNVQTSKYLAARVMEDPTLELVFESKLSICLFRMKLPSSFSYVKKQYNNHDRTETETETETEIYPMAEDDLNHFIRDKIKEKGSFLMSEAYIAKRPVLRCMIVNYNIRPSHIDQFLVNIKHVGKAWIETNNVNERFQIN